MPKTNHVETPQGQCMTVRIHHVQCTVIDNETVEMRIPTEPIPHDFVSAVEKLKLPDDTVEEIYNLVSYAGAMKYIQKRMTIPQD